MTETFVNHCITFYEKLDEVSVDVELDSRTVRRFAGKITEVWKSTGLAQTYYTPVMRTLERHNAILKVQRGGRNADTVYLLNGLPDTWDVDGWKGETSLTKSRLTFSDKLDTITSRLKDIEKLLGGLNVVEALEAQAKEITNLSEKVKALEAEIILMTPVTRKKRNQDQS